MHELGLTSLFLTLTLRRNSNLSMILWLTKQILGNKELIIKKKKKSE